MTHYCYRGDGEGAGVQVAEEEVMATPCATAVTGSYSRRTEMTLMDTRLGHFARECPEGDGGNSGGGVCYRCDR